MAKDNTRVYGLRDPKNRNVNGRPRVLTEDDLITAREMAKLNYKKYVIAEQLGVSRSTLYRYLAGIYKPVK